MNLRKKKQDFIIPMNSMSDVAFLLLIFIMLVSLMNYRREVKIEYPEAVAAKKTSLDKNLEIWIDRAGAIYLDGLPSDLNEIEIAITDIYRNAPDTRVHVIADRDARFADVNRALQLLQFLQYRVVSFVVKDA